MGHSTSDIRFCIRHVMQRGARAGTVYGHLLTLVAAEAETDDATVRSVISDMLIDGELYWRNPRVHRRLKLAHSVAALTTADADVQMDMLW